MTKTGKPDSYWEGIMYQYAQGKYRFSTGKKPGSKKWKAVMQLIRSCPLTPIFNLPVRRIDIFGCTRESAKTDREWLKFRKAADGVCSQHPKCRESASSEHLKLSDPTADTLRSL
ncbi:unnamed protein product [Pleuronectes platessa]|uniref:Uncharacterized protein n=1 Tax=Pleuronectes platessa TaxID=8262 RepID=A0A9N7U727_PLEPL|nr:unnamed protein product [Pleuronectes platessa]